MKKFMEAVQEREQCKYLVLLIRWYMIVVVHFLGVGIAGKDSSESAARWEEEINQKSQFKSWRTENTNAILSCYGQKLDKQTIQPLRQVSTPL